MRKLLLSASALIPTVLLAGSLAAQSPLPQDQSPRGASPSTQSPQAPGGGAGGRTEQPTSPGVNQRAPDATGGERAQGGQPEMQRQKSGAGTSDEMQRQGKGESTKPPRTQDAQRPEEGTPKRDAQRPEEGTQRRDAQRPATEEQNRDAQRRQEGGTEQRTGKSESDVETTGSVDISSEKRTTIRETITRERVTPIRDVNFSINVGVAVPRTVELRPLPERVIEIVPQYRRYRYFVLEDGRIVIVEPSSYKIVYVITA